MTDSEAPVFFIDRGLGSRYVAQALQEAGATVEVFEPHFASDTPDTVWLPEVSQRGWFVLTKDDNIGRNPLEQIAIAQSQARVFILAIGNLTGREMGAIFAAALPKMQKLAKSHRSPFIARVHEGGKVRMWQDHKRLNKLLAQFVEEDTQNS